MTGDVTVRYDNGGVAWILFGNPGDGNALTWDLGRRLASAITEAGSKARCVVLASSGRTFCAGANLGLLRTLADPSQAGHVREEVYGSFQALIRAIVSAPAPVIARVQGPALGAGADLCLAADMRIASERAWLEESWIKLGVISALGGAHTLPRLVGSGNALDLLLTARRLNAAEAHQFGVFQRVTSPDLLDEEVMAVTAAIARADPLAVRAMKRLLRAEDGLEAALERALDEQVPLIARFEFARHIENIQAVMQLGRTNR